MRKIKFFIFIFLVMITSLFSQFSRYQKIVEGEYFIDFDPGEGMGTPIQGTYNFGEVTIKNNGINLPTNSNIYIRFKSSNGYWSAPRSIRKMNYFLNSQGKLKRGEYFINTDPGIGKGIAMNFNGEIAVIENPKLKRSDLIYFRIQDSFNRWSPARPFHFRFKDITNAEYYCKHTGGNSTSIKPITINPSNELSGVFIATKENIACQKGDTVCVRFLTSDKFYSKWAKIYITDVETVPIFLPLNYELSQNYPNPFNPSTSIKIALPQANQVKLAIYNMLGEEVRLLLNEEKPSGMYEIQWDGKNTQGVTLPSGVYFYSLSAGNFQEIRKMILAK